MEGRKDISGDSSYRSCIDKEYKTNIKKHERKLETKKEEEENQKIIA